MTTHYNGSRGPVLIADMPYTHLKNALAKLEREDPSRIGEIEAMRADVERRDIEHAAKVEAEADAAAASSDAADPFEDNAPEHFAADHGVDQ